jgi:hypothetical protein
VRLRRELHRLELSFATGRAGARCNHNPGQARVISFRQKDGRRAVWRALMIEAPACRPRLPRHFRPGGPSRRPKPIRARDPSIGGRGWLHRPCEPPTGHGGLAPRRHGRTAGLPDPEQELVLAPRWRPRTSCRAAGRPQPSSSSTRWRGRTSIPTAPVLLFSVPPGEQQGAKFLADSPMRAGMDVGAEGRSLAQLRLTGGSTAMAALPSAWRACGAARARASAPLPSARTARRSSSRSRSLKASGAKQK